MGPAIGTDFMTKLYENGAVTEAICEEPGGSPTHFIDISCFIPSRSTTTYSEARSFDRGSLGVLVWHLGTISSTRVTDERDSDTYRSRHYPHARHGYPGRSLRDQVYLILR